MMKRQAFPECQGVSLDVAQLKALMLDKNTQITVLNAFQDRDNTQAMVSLKVKALYARDAMSQLSLNGSTDFPQNSTMQPRKLTLSSQMYFLK